MAASFVTHTGISQQYRHYGQNSTTEHSTQCPWDASCNSYPQPYPRGLRSDEDIKRGPSVFTALHTMQLPVGRPIGQKEIESGGGHDGNSGRSCYSRFVSTSTVWSETSWRSLRVATVILIRLCFWHFDYRLSFFLFFPLFAELDYTCSCVGHEKQLAM